MLEDEPITNTSGEAEAITSPTGNTDRDDVRPPREEVILDLDDYVLEWFQAQGEDYEDLMNQVLRDYIEAEETASEQADLDQNGK